jgi:ubiquinone/menaquinone biosynthesis C-methylase UbiE
VNRPTIALTEDTGGDNVREPANANPDYVLGHSPEELLRLARQGHYWGEATLEVLERSGITAGMHVVDIGCGPGDVSLLAGALVGSEGSVLGIDRSPEAIAAATERARTAGLSNVRFQTQDLNEVKSPETFDALLGRFVLMYFAEPGDMIRGFLPSIRRGGVVAFLEMDMNASRSVPAVPLVETTLEWLRETFRQARVPCDLGPQVWRVFRAAGLPEPALSYRSRVEASPARETARYLTETVRSLLPMMERFGVATASEVSIETLAQRLNDALLAADATLLPPAVVGAWTRVP